MSEKERAQEIFGQGFNCAQAVAAAYAEDFGLAREDALRVAAAFGGGIGRTGHTCGAVSGALIVLGLKHAALQADPQAKERMYLIAQDFMKRFEGRYGALECRELLGVDLNTPEGRQAAKDRNTHGTVCMGLVVGAGDILDEMLRR